MPATKTKGIKKATSEFKAGKRDAVLQHVLASSDAGKEPEEFTLIISEREDKKERKVIHAFATSVSVDVVCGFKRDQMTGAEAFVEQYRARWSIETGYRCAESMRPRTTGREESVRVLLLFAPNILFNAWILASHLLQRDSPYACCLFGTFCSTPGRQRRRSRWCWNSSCCLSGKRHSRLC